MDRVDSSATISSTPQVDTHAFDSRFSILKSDFIALWQATPETTPSFGKEYDLEEQLATEAKVEEAMIEQEDVDPDPDEWMARLQRMKSTVRNLVTLSIVPEDRGETEAMLEEFSDAGDEFVRQARAFDPELGFDDIYQALRNLWIINSMQVGFGLPVKVTPSALAYSLLYPYSDNYLDDPSITTSEKQEFNRRFRRRLSGFESPRPTGLESRIFDLVEMIESEFPRAAYPEVYESLLAIQRGQEKSLSQHAQSGYRNQSSLLEVSVEKGGASVLADAYLAKGSLSTQEAAFSFGYGSFLQFIDDLQDVEEDLRNGHQTLFTRAASKSKLDEMANRLNRYVDSVIGSSDPSVFRHKMTLTELVRRSCRFLIIESTALSPRLYSESYLLVAERHSPMTFTRLRGFHDTMQRKQARLKKALNNKSIRSAAVAYV
jgi:hypothetical protein